MYSRFLELLKDKNVTAYRVSKETGIPQTTLSAWKTGISNPKADKLQLIADYFGVSVDWLLGNTDIKEVASNEGYYNDPDVAALAEELRTNPEYRVLFDASKNLSKKDIQFVMDMIDTIRKREEYED